MALLDITPAQTRVRDALRARLQASPGSSPTLAELADDLEVTPPTIAAAINRLKEGGWVTNKKHQRRSLAFTEEALKFFKA